MIWNKVVTHDVFMFLWRLLQNKLLIRDNFVKKNMVREDRLNFLLGCSDLK